MALTAGVLLERPLGQLALGQLALGEPPLTLLGGLWRPRPTKRLSTCPAGPPRLLLRDPDQSVLYDA
jgi:hypothetical protein